MPQSAFFSAGASFTPSPVMPTMWPRFCRTSTIWNLCSGNTCAKPSAFSIASADRAVCLLLRVAQAAGIEDICTHPQFLGGLLGDGQRIAGDHLDLHAHLFARSRSWPWHRPAADRTAAARRETAIGRPPRPAPRPSERKPRAANSLTALSTAGFTCAGIGRQFQDHLRRALRDLERLSVRAFHIGLGAFMHRVERLEMLTLIALQGLIVLQAAENGEVDGVAIVGTRRQRRR